MDIKRTRPLLYNTRAKPWANPGVRYIFMSAIPMLCDRVFFVVLVSPSITSQPVSQPSPGQGCRCGPGIGPVAGCRRSLGRGGATLFTGPREAAWVAEAVGSEHSALLIYGGI